MTVKSGKWAAIFLAVPLTLYLAFVVGPSLYSFYYGFTDWNFLTGEANFTGLENFRRLLDDDGFWSALQNTIIWTALGLLISVVGGFWLALALSRLAVLERLIKSLFFLPMALSLVVVGFIWFWIYRLDFGFANILLRAFGFEDLATAWLADRNWALFAVILAWGWQQIALSMIVFLAGLTSVPKELMEAATMDGARFRHQLSQVIIPSVRPATGVVISLALINSLKSFDIVWVMTGGGPFEQSETLAVLIYRQAFRSYEFGYSSTIAVALFVITLVIIGGSMLANRRRGDE
jgi:multiple sugar transport system permease protein/raffinose/stachyose/melibiose transport system permease protein